MSVDAGNAPISMRYALAQVAGFTFLNPHVYLDTVLLMGSIGARQPTDMRLWFVGGAAAASGTWFTTLGFGARLTTYDENTAETLFQLLDPLGDSRGRYIQRARRTLETSLTHDGGDR